MKQVLQGNLDAIDFIKANRAKAEAVRRHADPEDHEQADRREPGHGVVRQPAVHARPAAADTAAVGEGRGAVGLLQPPKKLFKIYDLEQLNSILKAAGQSEVTVKEVKIPAGSTTATPLHGDTDDSSEVTSPTIASERESRSRRSPRPRPALPRPRATRIIARHRVEGLRTRRQRRARARPRLARRRRRASSCASSARQGVGRARCSTSSPASTRATTGAVAGRTAAPR